MHRFPAHVCSLLAIVLTLSVARGNLAEEGSKNWKRSDDSLIPEPVQVLIDQQTAVIQQQSAMIQQQSAMIQQQSADIQALQTRMTATENTIQKLQQKVAFTAYFNESGPINIGDSSPIPFGHVSLNAGNGYDPHTGVFTAPVSGAYLFLLYIKNDGQKEWDDIGLMKSDTFLTFVTVNNVGEKSSISITAHVDAGDTVSARSSADTVIIDRWRQTSFSGILLFAD